MVVVAYINKDLFAANDRDSSSAADTSSVVSEDADPLHVVWVLFLGLSCVVTIIDSVIINFLFVCVVASTIFLYGFKHCK